MFRNVPGCSMFRVYRRPPWPATKEDKCCFFMITKPFADRRKSKKALRANVNKVRKQAKRGECLPCERLVQGRGMWERKLCLHTALNRTFTISKVNLNLQYFCLIIIWSPEMKSFKNIWNINVGFWSHKITSNEPWNTETHQTDRNPPITNHKQWPFEHVEENFRFLRGPLGWLTSDIFLTRGSKCTNHRKTVLIACFLRGHLNLLFSLFFVHFLFPIWWLVNFASSSG